MAVQAWWDGLPIVTKTLFGASFGLTLVGNFGLISPMTMILDFGAVYNRFQVGRIVALTLCLTLSLGIGRF